MQGDRRDVRHSLAALQHVAGRARRAASPLILHQHSAGLLALGVGTKKGGRCAERLVALDLRVPAQVGRLAEEAGVGGGRAWRVWDGRGRVLQQAKDWLRGVQPCRATSRCMQRVRVQQHSQLARNGGMGGEGGAGGGGMGAGGG
jgi:hypothetical protein